MTPKERVMNALRGQEIDQIPMTIYGDMLPRGSRERRLREAGWAISQRVPVVRVSTPHVEVIESWYTEAGVRHVRVTLRTPVGESHCIQREDDAYGTSYWTQEYFIKGPADYKVIEYLYRDMVFEPNQAPFLRASDRLGEDGYVIGQIPFALGTTISRSFSPPMHHLMHHLMGIERFSIELAERRDDLLALQDVMARRQQEAFLLAVDSPADALMYGGNIHADLVGRRRFDQYYLPLLNEFAALAHQAGKMTMAHLDANLAGIKESVASCGLDIIEAFTPAPVCDMSVAEARAVWPDKVMWINFTSNIHLRPYEEVRAEALKILREAAPGYRFIMGVTEDIPEPAMWESLFAIAEVVREVGPVPYNLEG